MDYYTSRVLIIDLMVDKSVDADMLVQRVENSLRAMCGVGSVDSISTVVDDKVYSTNPHPIRDEAVQYATVCYQSAVQLSLECPGVDSNKPGYIDMCQAIEEACESDNA